MDQKNIRIDGPLLKSGNNCKIKNSDSNINNKNDIKVNNKILMKLEKTIIILIRNEKMIHLN